MPLGKKRPFDAALGDLTNKIREAMECEAGRERDKTKRIKRHLAEAKEKVNRLCEELEAKDNTIRELQTARDAHKRTAETLARHLPTLTLGLECSVADLVAVVGADAVSIAEVNEVGLDHTFEKDTHVKVPAKGVDHAQAQAADAMMETFRAMRKQVNETMRELIQVHALRMASQPGSFDWHDVVSRMTVDDK